MCHAAGLRTAIPCESFEEKPLTSALAHMARLLGNPIVASVLGLALAAGLLWNSRASFRAVTPENTSAGMAMAAISLFVRLAVATTALWAYKALVPTGLKPFAFSLAGGFLVMYTVEAVRFAGLHKYRRPAPRQ